MTSCFCPSHPQRKPEDPPIDLDESPPEPRTLKPAKPFSYPSSSKSRSASSPGGCASRLSPCCHSPAPRPHPKSTPCTPCPEPSPAVAAPRSPALSPHATPHLSKEAESQDKRGEGQPPQDYPHSLEPGENMGEIPIIQGSDVLSSNLIFNGFILVLKNSLLIFVYNV